MRPWPRVPLQQEGPLQQDGRLQHDGANATFPGMRLQGPRAACAAMLVLLAACVSPLPLEERLDERTGVSTRQMSRALEFFSPAPNGPDGSAFAHFGVFEANRMGTLSLFAWLSVLPANTEPVLPQGPLRLQVIGDGTAVELAYLASDPAVSGLSRTPFSRPARWARDGYFEVTAAQLRAMRGAVVLTLSIDDGSGRVRSYELWKEDMSPLHRFVDGL